MGYYGQSIYRGDFVHRGGFHPVMRGPRGDFLGDLGGILGKGGAILDKGMQYLPLVGGVINGWNKGFGAGLGQHPALQAPAVGGGGLALPTLPRPGAQFVKERGLRGGTVAAAKAAQRTEDRNDGGGRRRMNVCNTRALRRALRRADGFLKVAKHFVKVIKPGHHVQLKEHHHKHKRK